MLSSSSVLSITESCGTLIVYDCRSYEDGCGIIPPFEIPPGVSVLVEDLFEFYYWSWLKSPVLLFTTTWLSVFFGDL